MAHDFINFPELTNSQMETEYFNSPHKQITENFMAKVTRVHDGDTVSLQWSERDFTFPLRIIDIDAPELNAGGLEAKLYLKNLIEGEEVEVIIDSENRTEKWGRLLGDIKFKGILISEDMMITGRAWPFERRREGSIPEINWELKKHGIV